MAHIIEDRVAELSTTTGTGAFTLAGAITSYRAFSAVCATSDTVNYLIEAVDGAGIPTGEWETGVGTYSGANTLTRTTVYRSSNANSAVSFSAGVKRVVCVAPNVSTDGTLAGNSDTKIATQKAVKAYVDANAGGASTTQTAEPISGFIASPANKDYRIVVKMPHGGTITETTTISASGTCTATFKINSTALGGTANSVSSSEQSQSHSGTNTFVAGDDIVLTISSNSACTDMSFTIKYTRVLES